MEYAAKFISTRAKKKPSALREMNLVSKLDHERVLYFHDAFEKKNAVIIITEMYPSHIITVSYTRFNNLHLVALRSLMEISVLLK